jgi:NAD(P)-dependent dehydrogenase (short-subunit alcohol dehydrogenase family)
MNNLELEVGGKIMVIGDGRGIGLATRDYLTDCEEEVIGLDLSHDELEGVTNLNYVGYHVDVCDFSSLKKLSIVLQEGGTELDGLVYCVGNNHLKWIGEGIYDLARDLYESNVLGIFAALECFLPLMHDYGRIVLLSSIAGEIPMRTTVPYCTTKAAVDMMTMCLARELAPRPVFCVKPGPTAGDNSYADIEEEIVETRGWPREDVRRMTLADIPMKKLATEKECARVIYHCLRLIPDHASGTTIRLTGGR